MGDKPTHVMMVRGKGKEWNGKPIYPAKGYVNFGKDQYDEEFDWEACRRMSLNDAIDYLTDHLSFNCYTRAPGDSAKDRTHPIDKLDRFIDEEIGNQWEMEFRILREKPYEGGGGNQGRGGGRGGGSGRDSGRGGGSHGRGGGGRGGDDEPRGQSRRQSFDRQQPNDGFADDDDDPFNEGN